jgi:hypothetical protein
MPFAVRYNNQTDRGSGLTLHLVASHKFLSDTTTLKMCYNESAFQTSAWPPHNMVNASTITPLAALSASG